MSIVKLVFRSFVKTLLALVAGLLVLWAAQIPTRAAQIQTFTIPATDGYGIEDCMTTDKACGRIVADAWCKAHGLAMSLAFGRADDVTASTGTPTAAVEPSAFIVTCGD
jgi:hypothetical protein